MRRRSLPFIFTLQPKSLLEVAVFRDKEMTTRRIEQVHGYSISELEKTLQDSCDILMGAVSLEVNALGGWSNINLRGQSDEHGFVLKLPWSVSAFNTNPYDQLFETTLHFNELGIAPRPLAKGWLEGDRNLPFIILEYIEGLVYDSFLELSDEELVSLKDCLGIIAEQKPPGLKRYQTSSEHMTTRHSLVMNHVGLSTVSNEVGLMVAECEKMYPEVLSYTDSLGEWPQSLMHGDLWIPNIIFQADRVRLLDFEDSAYGHHLYDIAYLLETPECSSESQASSIIPKGEIEAVNALRPVAVAYIINWSLERLMSMESGFVEPNLSTEQIRTAVIGYTRSKITRLKTLLSS
jgi:aminoglycoside phosphotransferase (APT) family kinase protein